MVKGIIVKDKPKTLGEIIEAIKRENKMLEKLIALLDEVLKKEK